MVPAGAVRLGVAMPPEAASELGTTVNGMWADPERRSADDVSRAHEAGRRVLFSVPMIALTPRVYAATPTLLDEVCRDAAGQPSECGWHDWESNPVYAACIYSDPFRRYLFDRCVEGVDRGMDVVNLDEMMTSAGLMNRDPLGSGFCPRCLERFRSHLLEGHRVILLPEARELGASPYAALVIDPARPPGSREAESR